MVQELRDVVARPEGLLTENVGFVLPDDGAWDLFEDDKEAVLQRLAGLEKLVINDHPLVVVPGRRILDED